MRVSGLMLLGGAGLALWGLLRGLVSPRSRGRVFVAGGLLQGPQSSVRLTDGDILWLARALAGETGGRDPEGMAAVTWTLAQNLMLVRRRRAFKSFTELVRAYSQPVSAAWADPASSKCSRHPEACTEARIARRRRIQGLAWAEIPDPVKLVVGKFRRGTLHNPVPGAVDFAAFRFPGATVNIGGNWFGVGSTRRLV